MIGCSFGKSFAAGLGLAAIGSMIAAATPAMAHSGQHHGGRHTRISAHHAAIRHQAYRAGYDRGFREGHLAAADPDLVTGRSAYDGPAVGAGIGYGGPFENGGVLGTGVLDGEGVLGTGVLSGQGALGVGILGF